MVTLYLAHNFLTRKKIRVWELKIEGKYNIKLDNPFYDNPNRTEEMKALDSYKDASKEQQDVSTLRSSKDIIEDDLEKIRKSDGIVAMLNDARIGTPMEVFFAARILRIPVYIITKKYISHPWVLQHSVKVFLSKSEFEEYIKKKYGMKR